MGTYLSWAAGVATSVELHRNVNNFDTGMAIFGKNLTNSEKARPERVSFANAHESFKGGAKLALCPKKFGKKLSRLGRASWAGLASGTFINFLFVCGSDDVPVQCSTTCL